MIIALSEIKALYLAKNTLRTSKPSTTEWGDWVELTPILDISSMKIDGNPGEILYIGSDGTVDTSPKMTFDGDTIFVNVAAADKKAFQVKNQNVGLGVVTMFVDSNDHGGFSVEEDGGTNTGFKTRGDQSEHSYFIQRHVSINRGGSSAASGNGSIDGAVFTIFDQSGSELNASNVGAISGDADDYLFVASLRNAGVNDFAAIGLSSDGDLTAGQTVGAALVHEKLGNNGAGNLHIGVKSTTTNGGDLDTALSFTIARQLVEFGYIAKMKELTTTEINALNAAQHEGAIVYNTTTNKHVGCDGSTWNNLY